MYTDFGRIILDFISSFFLSSLNNSLIPAIIKPLLNTQRLSCIPSQWAPCIHTLGLSIALSHSKHICPQILTLSPKAPLPFPLLLLFGTLERQPELDPQPMGPHSELEPRTDLAKQDEERETMKVQANNSDDCSVKNNNHNKRTQTQTSKEHEREEGDVRLQVEGLHTAIQRAV